jgi:basic membrane protein A
MATGRVLTSVIKRIDTAVYDSIKAVKEGRFKGGLTVLGIREGGISLSPMTYTKDFIVALDGRIMKRLSDVSRMIREGTIVVPDTREKLNGFKAPTEIEWR